MSASATQDGDHTVQNEVPAVTEKTMKAVRFHGKEDLRLEDIPEPVCGKGQVKVKPAWCGICGRVKGSSPRRGLARMLMPPAVSGDPVLVWVRSNLTTDAPSDLHEFLGGPSLCPTSPHPITGETVPLTFGHEFSGTIEEVGEGVSDKFSVGDRVCVQPIIYDGTCGACREGMVNCCYSNGFVGLSGWGGGLSEHVVVPEYAVVRLPDNVPLDVAALVEPLAVGWHAVNASPFKPGDAALVLGGGPIGLAVIQALKARGCGKIIVSEVSRMRKEYAKDFGAHHVLDPSVDDIVARCLELCDDQGVHVAFDAAGVQAALTQAIKAVRVRGTLVNIAIWEKPASIVVNDMVFRERKYLGVATYLRGDFQEVISAISSGKLDKAKDMITKRITLDEVVEEGFHTLIRDKDRQVKILVRAGSGEV